MIGGRNDAVQKPTVRRVFHGLDGWMDERTAAVLGIILMGLLNYEYVSDGEDIGAERQTDLDVEKHPDMLQFRLGKILQQLRQSRDPSLGLLDRL